MAAKKSIVSKVTSKVAELYEGAKNMIGGEESPKKASAKKTPARKAPAKKAAARQAPAKKASAKKTPAKKAAVKKPIKNAAKAPAKKTKR